MNISREKLTGLGRGLLTSLCIFLCACAQEEVPDGPAESGVPQIRDDTSYTDTFRCTYELRYSDGTMQSFDLDGVLEVEEDRAHYTQNIYGNGASSVLEGWYYDGRLYNTYNGVTYYEDMTQEQLKQAMQVQLEPYALNEEGCEVNGEERVCVLTDPEKVFLGHYDFYGFDQVKGVVVDDGTVTQTVRDGTVTGEKAVFHAHLEDSGVRVDILYDSAVERLKTGDTHVVISDGMRQAHTAYVHYSEIDTDAISDADIHDDSPEDTVEATFRKRLVSRLNYSELPNGQYKSEFNENESYTVDFANRQFIYTNYSIRYVYNWAGDIGVFGTSCTYELGTGDHSSTCDEDVLEMIETVKLFFRMELYYCGLSLEDLQAETAQ